MDGGRYRLRECGAAFSLLLVSRVGELDKRLLPIRLDIADADREYDGGVASVHLPPLGTGMRDEGGVLRWRVPPCVESGGVG